MSASSEPPSPPHGSTDEPSEARECVLVIEDNALNMKLFSALLEAQGYAVLQAETGYSGLALARGRHPDLILLDIDLPDVSGLEIAAELKADPATRDIPILAATAAMPDAEHEALASGCDGFLTKPVSMSTLRDAVAGLLRDRCAGPSEQSVS